MFKGSGFSIRTATNADLAQLIELEKEWPENARATADQLALRIQKFSQGFFIGEDENGFVGSLITHPYSYQPDNLLNYKNWNEVVNTCYSPESSHRETNALYIISGTTKKTRHGAALFDQGMLHAIELATQLGKKYIVGGALLYGYADFIAENHFLTAEDYVFTRTRGRFIDPLIEKYHRIGFVVPDKNHIIANYFPHAESKNYSALVVKKL